MSVVRAALAVRRPTLVAARRGVAAAAPRRVRAYHVVTAGAGAAVAGSAYLYATNEGLWRYMRVGASLLPMAVDYARVSWRVRGRTEADAAAAFRAYHQRWADEPLAVCLDLRGFYVKIGQVMSGQPDMIPEPYLSGVF